MMEMETHLPLHHPHPHHQGSSFIYLVLGLILLMPIIWQEFGSERVEEWHPFFDVKYSLYWYLTLTSMRMKPVFYLVVARLAQKRHYLLIHSFLAYEITMFLDHILTYSQSDTRKWLTIILAAYMVWYHYKYENIEGWIK